MNAPAVVTACIDTNREVVLYRDFAIEEFRTTGGGRGWELSHEGYARPGSIGYRVMANCETLFECIDEIERWHASRSESALRTIREGDAL